MRIDKRSYRGRKTKTLASTPNAAMNFRSFMGQNEIELQVPSGQDCYSIIISEIEAKIAYERLGDFLHRYCDVAEKLKRDFTGEK